MIPLTLFDKFRDFVTDRLRMVLWPAAAIVLLVILNRPEQLDVLLYKGAMITVAAWVGYWIDRHLFYYARPHTVSDDAGFTQAALRRAIVVSAVILAFAIGL